MAKLTKKEYTVEEYLLSIEDLDNGKLFNRYLKKVSSGSYEPDPIQFQKDLVTTLAKKDGTNYMYPYFARIVAYPCYKTIVNKMYWDVHVLLANEGCELNLDSVCKDINSIFKATNFKDLYKKLSYKKDEKDYKQLIEAIDRIFEDLIIKRALNNEPRNAGDGV